MTQEDSPIPRAAPPPPAGKRAPRATHTLAAFVGFAVMALAVVLLFQEWPLGSALAVFVAGLVLLPFIPIPGQGSRTALFILALAYAIFMPAWEARVVHRQTQAAFLSAADTAARLADTAVKDGAWHTEQAGALPDRIEVDGDGWSRDVMLTDCGGADCTLIVRLTDARYEPEVRDRSFGLFTHDGGRTWSCGSAGQRSVMPSDLPRACRDQGPP